MFGGDLARLALQPVAEHHAVVAGLPGAGRRRGERVGRPGDDAIDGIGKNPVARLRRFIAGIVERTGYGLRQVEPVSADDGAGVGERGRIGHRRSRADHRRIVARHVGNGERDHAGRMRAPRQPAALDAGEMLSHAVDLADSGAAAQERPRRRLLFRKRDAGSRRDPIGRGAAGQEHQNEIVGAGCVGQRQRPLGAGKTGFVRDRMPSFDHGNAPGRAAVAVAGHRDAVEPARRNSREIVALSRLGERARALAGGKDDKPPARRLGQVRRQAARRMRGAYRRTEQGLQKFARLRHHGGPRFARPRTMATGRPGLYLLHS